VDEIINQKPPEMEMELPEDVIMFLVNKNPYLEEFMERLNLELEF